MYLITNKRADSSPDLKDYQHLQLQHDETTDA